ncbi:hypothetical protein H7J86_20975 [Mycobacterium hackensackense]|uniref:hypothetical protein n=1 Tax=Mycobacterium hackensackense TaxID=228909 RepID=UPI0022658CB0|nr:hypothetical protein [Mycobacterium hackensackense]MCV7254640.1 hypothetical protein [Mycobacterium hackensackense]
MHSSDSAQFQFKDFGALLAGLGMLVAGFAVITALPGWVTHWGTVAVYLTYFLYMSIAGRLFWKGTDAAWAAIKPRTTPAAPITHERIDT